MIRPEKYFYFTLPSLVMGMMLIFFLVGDGIAEQHQKASNKKEEFVSIDFNNVDIRVFIKFISNLSDKNFIVDKRVKGSVTIISPKRISIDDAYKVFESVLDIHGFATVQAGKVTKIIPAPNAASDNVNTRLVKEAESTRDQIVTRIVPLEYAGADELKPLLQPFVSPKSIILSYRDTNMLIITSTLSSINRLLKIIDTIDIQSTGKKISVIPIIHADAQKLTQGLSKIFAARVKSDKKSGPKDLNVRFVADERTNSIIVLASKTETSRVEDLISLLDQKLPKGEEKIKVYYLEHASAENLVKVLQDIPGSESTTQTKQNNSQPLLSKNIKISADQSTNSLIIVAEKEDYPVLEDVIAKLDIPRAMVYIECLIMEVNVNKGLNIGTEWKTATEFNNDTRALFSGFGATEDSSGYANLDAITSDGTLPSGFSIGMLGKNISIGGITFPTIQAVIQAYQSDKDVHILATPQLLTTENDEATITVGKNVPFQTRSAADSGSETYSSFEYKDVGITLKITPQISKGRLVRLNVFQELTKLDSANQTTPDRPTTLKRHIETSIIVEDSSTVVIGGLIDESLSKNQKKVPCLGDIPILGYGFKSVSEGEEKTNLYVFLTPKVIQNPLESKKLSEEKKLEILKLKDQMKHRIRPILIEP